MLTDIESFDDFDFGLEAPDMDMEFSKTDICGLVQKLKKKKHSNFSIEMERQQLKALIEHPPSTDECYKMLSIAGGFSSISIIKYIAELEGIEELYASTFRVGHRQFECLCALRRRKKLGKVHLVTSTTQKNTDRDYNYFEVIERFCKQYSWDLKVYNNHSKLILMRTPQNNYVVETSSNLNENPKIEQFSWENDKVLFDWYVELFVELMK